MQQWQMPAVVQIQEHWHASSFRDRRAQVAALNRWEVDDDNAPELDPAELDLTEQIRVLRHIIRTSLHP